MIITNEAKRAPIITKIKSVQSTAEDLQQSSAPVEVKSCDTTKATEGTPITTKIESVQSKAKNLQKQKTVKRTSY